MLKDLSEYRKLFLWGNPYTRVPCAPKSPQSNRLWYKRYAIAQLFSTDALSETLLVVVMIYETPSVK